MDLHTTETDGEGGTSLFRVHLSEGDPSCAVLGVAGEGATQLDAVKDLAFKLVELIVSVVPTPTRQRTTIEEAVECRRTALELLGDPETEEQRRWIATGNGDPNHVAYRIAEALMFYRRAAVGQLPAGRQRFGEYAKCKEFWIYLCCGQPVTCPLDLESERCCDCGKNWNRPPLEELA